MKQELVHYRTFIRGAFFSIFNPESQELLSRYENIIQSFNKNDAGVDIHNLDFPIALLSIGLSASIVTFLFELVMFFRPGLIPYNLSKL